MLANYMPVKVYINTKPTLIEQGVYHTSEVGLSKRWDANRKTVKKFLNRLETDSMISVVRSRQNGTTIKLINYAVYQEFFVGKGTTEGSAGKQAVEQQEYSQVVIPVVELSEDSQPQKEKTKSCMPKQMQDSFDVFWAAYPKKVSKGDARKAWKQIQPSSELLTKMLSVLGRAKTCSSWKKDGGQYIPHPATWLRAEGWDDEIDPAQNFTQGGNVRRET